MTRSLPSTWLQTESPQVPPPGRKDSRRAHSCYPTESSKLRNAIYPCLPLGCFMSRPLIMRFPSNSEYLRRATRPSIVQMRSKMRLISRQRLFKNRVFRTAFRASSKRMRFGNQSFASSVASLSYEARTRRLADRTGRLASLRATLVAFVPSYFCQTSRVVFNVRNSGHLAHLR